MDFKDILSQLTQLSEATEKTKTGLKHTAEPGGYGRKHDTDEEGEEKKEKKSDKKDEPKRGRGRPKKGSDDSGEVKKYDFSAFGGDKKVKLKPWDKKKTTKHSLKEWVEEIENKYVAEAVPPGMKPLAILDPKNQSAGAGVVTSKNPAIQKMLGGLDPKDVQIVMTTQQGSMQPAAGQRPTATSGGATNQPAMAEEGDKKWIQKAIDPKKKGALRKKLHAKPGEPIPAGKLEKATHSSDPTTARQARLAQTLRGLKKEGMGEEQLDELSPETIASYQKKAMPQAMTTGPKSDQRAAGVARSIGKGTIPKQVQEGDIPSDQVDMGAGLGAGRKQEAFEGKRPDYPDIDNDGDTTEPISKAAQDKKKKTKVKESMDTRLKAAHHRGKAHALSKESYNCKYDDMEEARMYHEGYKEGLDECYGQVPIRGTVVGEEVGTKSAASKFSPTMHDRIKNASKQELSNMATSFAGDGFGSQERWDDEYKLLVQAQRELLGGANVSEEDVPATVSGMADQAEGLDEMDMYEMDKTEWMKQQARKTPGDTFKAFGQTMHDKDVLETSMFESWDKELNGLLTEYDTIQEGLTVSISKGQQGAPDSVSVTAQDQEADQLLSIIKSAGLGLFGDEHGQSMDQSSPMSLQPADGGEEGDIDVVGDHDGMMALIKKVTGGAGEPDTVAIGGDNHSQDYEEEDGEEACDACGHADCQCDHEEDHGEEEQVDEVESEDQMEYEVAEDNAPDSGAEETADEDQEIAADNAAASSHGGADDEQDLEESEQLDEWANEAGQNGTDAAFEADIAFMTKVIAGGLNKEKATGQTTIPVIPGQKDRMGYSGINESINDWKKLAGLK